MLFHFVILLVFVAALPTIFTFFSYCFKYGFAKVIKKLWIGNSFEAIDKDEETTQKLKNQFEEHRRKANK